MLPRALPMSTIGFTDLYSYRPMKQVEPIKLAPCEPTPCFSLGMRLNSKDMPKWIGIQNQVNRNLAPAPCPRRLHLGPVLTSRVHRLVVRPTAWKATFHRTQLNIRT